MGWKNAIKIPKDERVSKVLIFMAGMEAERFINKKSETENQRNPTKQLV